MEGLHHFLGLFGLGRFDLRWLHHFRLNRLVGRSPFRSRGRLGDGLERLRARIGLLHIRLFGLCRLSRLGAWGLGNLLWALTASGQDGGNHRWTQFFHKTTDRPKPILLYTISAESQWTDPSQFG